MAIDSFKLCLACVSGLDETAVYQYISKLTKPGSSGAGSDTSPYLSGNCTAKEYSPSVFKESQRRVVDEHFQINGVIEYITLTKHKVYYACLVTF